MFDSIFILSKIRQNWYLIVSLYLECRTKKNDFCSILSLKNWGSHFEVTDYINYLILKYSVLDGVIE